VLRAARGYLNELESRSLADRGAGNQLSLLESPVSPPPDEPHPLIAAVESLDPDALSPREALDTLYRLRKLLDAAD
jgi:DNA mismatch repair protein MutS